MVLASTEHCARVPPITLARRTLDALRLYIANTDPEWFAFLSRHQPLDEVNHWQPGGQQQFKAITSGELLVFRLRSPINKIAGYGVFARAALLPISLAWTSFGEKNGHPTFESFQAAIRRLNPKNRGIIGYRILTQPVFLPTDQWFPPPSDWPVNTVGGKRYSLESVEGRDIWERLTTDVAQRRSLGLAEPKPMLAILSSCVPGWDRAPFGSALSKPMTVDV